jgi:hypothetical protein
VVIKNRTLGYSAIQGFYWMGYASIMGFASVFLLNVGFDNSQVGLLIAAAGELRNLFLRFDGDPKRVRRLPMPTAPKAWH